MTLEFLKQFPGVELPHVYTLVLGSTDYPLSIRDGEGRGDGVLRVGVSGVCFDVFSRRYVPQPL